MKTNQIENQLIHLTSGFLTINRFFLFLLIFFPISIRIFSPSSDQYVILNRLLASIGGACLLCWLFAIAHKANHKLASINLHLNIFRFFNWSVLVSVISFLLILFFSTDVNTSSNNINIHYTTPIIFPVIFSVSFLSVIIITAKTLVSAEQNKDASFEEYFNAFILLSFAVIGLWYIHPRAQNL